MKYPAGYALKNITLEITAGATVAIVGHTGSGKSTLVSLIPRLFDPTRGAVFLDGIDLRDFDPEWLRRQIGFVPQETFLFSATLAENIAWASRMPRKTTSRAPRSWLGLRPTSRASQKGTALSSANAASPYPAARSNAWPSRAPSCGIQRF
jgi:ATP-binding cassette subfamily B protein